MKVNLLALDSASSICGVAVLQSDTEQTQITTTEHEGVAQHAEYILPLITQSLEQAQLKKNELNVIAFAQGPGGFTGLRVACGVAQGIAYALGLKVAPISSLLAVAAQQKQCSEAEAAALIEVVVVDARMQELYVGAYQRTATGWYNLHKPILINQPSFYYYLKQLVQQQEQLGTGVRVRVSGDGLKVFPDLMERISELDVLIGNTESAQVETIAELALLAYKEQRLVDPAFAAPLYVRNRVAFTIAERETGLGGNPSALWQSVQFRPLVQEQLASLSLLEAQLQTDPWTIQQFRQSLESGHWMWVVLYRHQVVAYAVVMPTVAEAELLLIGVAVEQQRQGIAQQLLCYVEQYARAQGCEKMHLEVRESNYAARELYEGAGYLHVGKRKDYYKKSHTERESALLYTKVLA